MFGERLSGIVDRVEDCRMASLVAADGIPVETAGSSEIASLDTEILAVELLTQLKSMSDNHGELSLGEVTQLSVDTDQCSVLLGKVAAEYYLLLILSAGSRTGRARFELRRAPLVFEEDLV